MISFARLNSATLFSAKVNHLIKCAFYTNTPLKRPKQETIRIFVINCMPCCNFTVNIGFLAANEDRNTVKLQWRFSPIRLWPRWTTFVPNGSFCVFAALWKYGITSTTLSAMTARESHGDTKKALFPKNHALVLNKNDITYIHSIKAVDRKNNMNFINFSMHIIKVYYVH